MAGIVATIGIIVTTGTAVITGTDLRFCRRAFLPRIGKTPRHDLAANPK
jgi:hypothetical protein